MCRCVFHDLPSLQPCSAAKIGKGIQLTNDNIMFWIRCSTGCSEARLKSESFLPTGTNVWLLAQVIDIPVWLLAQVIDIERILDCSRVTFRRRDPKAEITPLAYSMKLRYCPEGYFPFLTSIREQLLALQLQLQLQCSFNLLRGFLKSDIDGDLAKEMITDPGLGEFSGTMNGFKFDDESFMVISDQNFVNEEDTFLDHSFMDLPFLPVDPNPSTLAPSLNVSPNGNFPDCSEDCDLSDVVLNYINQMLMEEDMEEKSCMFQECSALQAAEKSFYEILGEDYPHAPTQPPPYVDPNTEIPNDNFPLNYNPPYANHNAENPDYNFGPIYNPPYVDHNSENRDGNFPSNFNNFNSSSSLVDPSWNWDIGESKPFHTQTLPVNHTSQSTSSSPNSVSNVVDGLVESPVSTLLVSDMFESQSIQQFRRGVEEASKFLPKCNSLIVDLENNGSLPWEPKEKAREMVVKVEKKDEREYSPNGWGGKKNHHRDDIDLEEGRSNKQSAVYAESIVRSEMFDRVLLYTENGEFPLCALQESLQNEIRKKAQQNGESKGSNGGKGRGKKQGGKRDVVDLRTLLIHCAQAISADDRRNANELLKQIRQNSSPFGDGSQRLAHCFADALEARLSGTGTQIYAALSTKRKSAADLLKAYQLYLAACPFKKLSNFFSNQTIMNVAENATRLHIIDFGILYGFQWPSLIQRLAARPGGPPKLRITGIEFPQPGFRPAERVEETGHRLANYAETFNVPFEYNAIAQKWETIQIEDLKIDKNEVVVVNCLYRLRNLLDETVVADSPRDAVLNLIRKMNPDVFIHGIVNGTYNAPFFVTRFREALFHFSAMLDMFENNIPREHPERLLLEKELFGREVLNAIACEGTERVERPETYKQWKVRNLRAGLRQLPLNPEIMKKAGDWVKSRCHKDFVIDQDSQWMIQGWKGRILYALSSWRPIYES
ncbi:hypothetical protein HHK36_016385 [Tetracentron sinense]|uniref:Scarecrow-like protein 9 n=1 Tax=Tetracentron sinense TaxID=13715 RepID=A0A835DBG0_TETSI|nr:hypothetical protein HHK36_016385 [Tetracentron sinense]